MQLRMIGIVVVCISVMSLFGTGAWGQAAEPTQAEPAAKTPTSAPSDVVATMDGKKLTYGQLQAFKKYFAPFGAEDSRIIDFWKVNTALAEEARKANIENDPEAQSVIAMLKEQLLGSIYVRQKQLNATVTDEEVKEYYEKNQNDRQFREGEFISAQVIVVPTKEDADKIKKELVEGKDFAKLVEENAEQTKKATKLESPEVKDQQVTELSKTLGPAVAYSMSSLPLNEVQGPRQTTSGWALFKVTDRRPGKLIPFEKVKEDIRRNLLMRKQSTVRSEVYAEAEKKAGIKREAPSGPGMRAPRMQVRPQTTQPAAPAKPAK